MIWSQIEGQVRMPVLPGGTERAGQPFCSIDSVSVAMLPIERNSRGFRDIGSPKHGA
jgi:hypothetical protein